MMHADYMELYILKKKKKKERKAKREKWELNDYFAIGRYCRNLNE